MKTKQIVCKFKKLAWGAESTDLLNYWHIVIPPNDFTACSAATDEYDVDYKEGSVTCPKCISVIEFCKNVNYKIVKRKQVWK